MSGLAVDPAVQIAARVALALLFGAAALHKLRDVGAFRAALDGYQLLPPLWAVPAGALLIAVEIGIAVGLCLDPLAPPAAVAAALLLGVYASAIAINLRRGRRDIDCGCAGPGRRQPIGVALVVRNSGLALVALLIVVPSVKRSLGWLDAFTVVAAVAALAALYLAAERLRSLGAGLEASPGGSRPAPTSAGGGRRSIGAAAGRARFEVWDA